MVKIEVDNRTLVVSRQIHSIFLEIQEESGRLIIRLTPEAERRAR